MLCIAVQVLQRATIFFATLEIRVEINEKGLPIDGTEQYTVLEAHGGIKHKKEDPQTIM